MAGFDAATALALHRPTVQYDSLESYYTDWAAIITDRPSNVLKRADGTVLAAAGPPTADVPQLNLAFLHPQTYPTGQPVAATDYLAEVGTDYVSQARAMHARPGYANKVHGRVVVQRGVTWLQYWFFMYYDDPGFLDLGTHEGDVEMIQLRLDSSGTPDAVTYAQHRSGVTATWAQVERQGASPVVYSARGTHASLLRRGDLTSDRSFLPDHNDAKGPRILLDLIGISEAQTPWAFWPGRWGGTRPESQILGDIGVEANSPTAPCQHKAWSDPAGFHNACEPADVPPAGSPQEVKRPAPPPPELHVELDGTHNAVNVRYDVPAAAGAADASQLVIGIDPSGGQQPPATTVIHLRSASGQLTAPLGPGGAQSVQVHATTHAPDGTASATASATAGP